MINNSKDYPVALLVIYDVGFKFKYKKYYLKKGSNFIGWHPSCHVIITDGEKGADKVANLQITADLATIQPLDKKCVYVPSNLKKKNSLMVEIWPGTKYVIEMEKDFIISGRKALIQISSVQQLLQIKGVINQDLFNLGCKSQGISLQLSNPTPPKINTPNNNEIRKYPDAQFQATIPLQGNSFGPTIPIGTFQYYEATQLIEDEQNAYDATLPLDADNDLIPQSYHRESEQGGRSSSQIYNSSQHDNNKNSAPILSPPRQDKEKRQNENSVNRLVSEAEISMPETIKQDEMPATIKQDQSIQAQPARDSEMFAPTIQENQIPEQRIQQLRKQATNMTKSQPAYRQIKKQKLENSTHKFTYEEKNKPVDSFQDLFGGAMSFSNANKTTSLISNGSSDQIKKKIKQTHSQNGSNKTQKIQSDKSDSQGIFSKAYKKKKQNPLQFISQVQPDFSQRELKKCLVLGKKISKIDSQKLSKKGYETIQQDRVQIQNLELLLIQGQLKLSQFLMLSLISGKQIKPYNWINNESAKVLGKLQGFTWQSIDKRKGKGSKIFSNEKTFYLQQDLREQFEKAMGAAGAQLIGELSKSKAKIMIHVVIDEKSKKGQSLYDEFKNYKKWSFYSKRMMIESILMGEEIIDKYKLDAYSF